MKTIYNLVIKDIIRFRKDSPAVILTFVVPIILIMIFGSIFGGNGGSLGKIPIILVNESSSPVAKLIESKLDTSSTLQIVKQHSQEGSNELANFTDSTAKQFVKEGRFSAAVIMPKDFFTDTSSSVKFKFYYDPKDQIESGIIQGTIQQTIMTQIPRLMPVLMERQSAKIIGQDSAKLFNSEFSKVIGKYFNVPSNMVAEALTKVDEQSLMDTSSEAKKNTAFMRSMVRFDQEQVVGTELSNPGMARTVGGWAVMFLLFSLTGASVSLFEEKQEGTLKRLLCMPVKRSQVLWSKYIYTCLLGIVQLLVLFIFAWLIYDVDIFANFFNLMIVIIASSLAAVAFGMIITSFAKSLGQASGISTLLILVMSAVGGSWFPVTLLPSWMQTISKFTITYWSVDAFLQVLWRQVSFSGIAMHVFVLLSIAFIVNFYSLTRFRQGKVF